MGREGGLVIAQMKRNSKQFSIFNFSHSPGKLHFQPIGPISLQLWSYDVGKVYTRLHLACQELRRWKGSCGMKKLNDSFIYNIFTNLNIFGIGLEKCVGEGT